MKLILLTNTCIHRPIYMYIQIIHVCMYVYVIFFSIAIFLILNTRQLIGFRGKSCGLFQGRGPRRFFRNCFSKFFCRQLSFAESERSSQKFVKAAKESSKKLSLMNSTQRILLYRLRRMQEIVTVKCATQVHSLRFI